MAAGRDTRRSHRVAGAPSLTAALQRPLPRAGSGRRGGDAAGEAWAIEGLGVLGHDRRAGALPGLFFPRGGGNSWPGSYGGWAEKADAYCFVSPVLGRGLPARSPSPDAPLTPRPGPDVRVPRRSPAAKGGASRDAGSRGLRAWRERARRRPGKGSPPGNCRAFPVKARPLRCGDIRETVVGGFDLLWLKQEMWSAFIRKLKVAPRSSPSGWYAPWTKGKR